MSSGLGAVSKPLIGVGANVSGPRTPQAVLIATHSGAARLKMSLLRRLLRRVLAVFSQPFSPFAVCNAVFNLKRRLSLAMTSRINLSESNDFLPRAQAVLARLETTLEQTFDALGLDVDLERAGGVLNIHVAKGKTVVINLQSPMQQIWLATPFGGFHYAWNGADWADTRGGAALPQRLSQDLSALTGLAVVVAL